MQKTFKNMEHRIREIIKSKGFTQQEFAEKLGIARESLARILNSPSYPSLVKIAEALNVPLWQLFASPEEVRKETDTAGNYVCPKCGAKLEIEIKEV